MQKNNLTRSLMQIHLPLLLVQIMFSLLPTFSKIAFQTFAPECIIFYRISGTAFLFGTLFFFFFFEPVERKHLLHFAVFAIFGVVANQFLFLKGLSYTKAINASILITSIPVFTLLTAHWLKHEAISLNKGIGVAIALVGVGLLIGFDKFDMQGALKGNLLILINAACFSVYVVISKPMLNRYHPFTVMTYIFLIAVILVFPLTFRQVMSAPYSQISLKLFMAPVVLVLFCTAFPYLVNALILKKTYSTVVAIYTYIQPLAGSLLAILVLGEKPTAIFFVSGVLILAGVGLVSFHNAVVWPNMLLFFRNKK